MADRDRDAADPQYLAARRRPFGDKFGLGRVFLAAFFLGGVLGIHAVIIAQRAVSRSPWVDGARITAWSLFAIVLCVFHTLEFVSTALYKWRDLSYDSFLLNHSGAYGFAMAAGALEFIVEGSFFIPPAWAVCLGLILVVFGQSLRFVAMATAREHFAHRIMTRRDHSHRLVTHGVYSVFRHPAYTGWFWWSIGTQLVLANPFCFFGYAWASWVFFKDRIPFEESTLVAFYPHEYPAYAKRTWIAIPFLPTNLYSTPS